MMTMMGQGQLNSVSMWKQRTEGSLVTPGCILTWFAVNSGWYEDDQDYSVDSTDEMVCSACVRVC